MTANTQTRYDFGRVTVEHVDQRNFTAPAWGTEPGDVTAVLKRGVTVRVRQSHFDSADEAMFSLFEEDARALAADILKALEGDE